jgi:hypothetical protein
VELAVAAVGEGLVVAEPPAADAHEEATQEVDAAPVLRDRVAIVGALISTTVCGDLPRGW